MSNTYAEIASSLDKVHQNHLKKLKVNDILSLVLLCVPKTYNDTSLLDRLVPMQKATISVKIISVQSSGFGKQMRLKIEALMNDFNEPLRMMIFHAKPFHKVLFRADSNLFVQGNLELFNGTYTLNQPKVITNINAVSPVFKTTLLNAKSLQTITQSIITLSHLKLANIPEEVALNIVEIFHPTRDFVRHFFHNGGFSKAHLDALKFIEMYHYLSRLSLKKRDFRPNCVCKNDISSFIASLPFALTAGQMGAINDIVADLGKDKACKRLIMGDVGCGKTMVILCAVMCAYPHKSILMCPTTILAKQLYEEARKYLPTFVEIELITAQSPKDTLNSLFSAHFIIGTQALLYRDLSAEKFALVMSDEQHRFGTNQRYALERLSSAESSVDSTNICNEALSQDSDNTKAIINVESTRKTKSHDAREQNVDATISNMPRSSSKTRPHILQFSATPIPRTLAMINSHFIDVSTIRDLPFKKDIDTRIVGKQDFKMMLAHLKDEVAKDHQAIIVYPLVEESEHLDYLSLNEGLSFWQRHFDGVYSTSGKDKDKQKVIDEFAKNGSILLATTVIEVGISLPRVSSIVIVAPERLGLATLHQLRGRVSRNGLKGYCYLYTHAQNKARLEAFANTINGFEIAELDLAYRSSGDLLEGKSQSGAAFTYFDIAQDRTILLNVQKALKIH